jgi:hypothetical protein
MTALWRPQDPVVAATPIALAGLDSCLSGLAWALTQVWTPVQAASCCSSTVLKNGHHNLALPPILGVDK